MQPPTQPPQNPLQPAATAVIRTGSPFAKEAIALRPHAADGDAVAGVAAETARGGVLASWLMVPFAVPCIWGFPLGGVMIAALGSLLGLVGCGSPRPGWAIAALLVHIILLVLAVIA